MSAEIKSGTESCKSTIEHETAGILRCQGLHLRQAFPTVHGNGQHGWDDSDPRIIPPTAAQQLPTAERTPADEPVPVPPPVDALLVLLDKWLEEDVDDHTANGWAAIREDIETRARALWAAGVAEGRRLLDETAATAAVHAYELGIAEGRRQATEERTEVERG